MNRKMIAAMVVVAVTAGCETNPPLPSSNPPPVTQAARPAPPPVPASSPPPEPSKPLPPVKSAAEVTLDQALALYDAGNYNGAIKALVDGKDIWMGPIPLKVKAYKYLAFSYCVTGRRTLCRQQFAEALKIDPTFLLEPAEKAHPIWGPQFEAARKAAAAPAVGRSSKPATPPKSATPPANSVAPAVKPGG